VSRVTFRDLFTKIAVVVVAWAGLTAALGCGGGGGDADKTFDGDGYSFTHPGSWSEREGEARVRRNVSSSFYFGPEEGEDVLVLDVGWIAFPITESNVDTVSDQFAGELAAIFRLARGRVTKGPTRLTVGGLPALRFEGSTLTPDGVPVRSQVTAVFDGRTQYFMNCQFTDERAEEMKRGCDQVVRSFRID
jgi:hypothetical protein